jgi:hypothetical protein
MQRKMVDGTRVTKRKEHGVSRNCEEAEGQYEYPEGIGESRYLAGRQVRTDNAADKAVDRDNGRRDERTGEEPPGLIYRWVAKGERRAVVDAVTPEIGDLVEDLDERADADTEGETVNTDVFREKQGCRDEGQIPEDAGELRCGKVLLGVEEGLHDGEQRVERDDGDHDDEEVVGNPFRFRGEPWRDQSRYVAAEYEEPERHHTRHQ